MNNPFERFYDTELSIYSQSDGSYTDGDTKEYLGKIICDLQPFSDNVEGKLFGLDDEKKFKLYSDKYPILKNGNLVLFGGGWHRIVRCEEWSFGMTAVIRSMENEG